MSNKILQLVAASLVIIMICSAVPQTEFSAGKAVVESVNQRIMATEVWSCNFDDGNISDWGIYAIAGEFPYDNPPGNFTVEDGALRVNGTAGGMSIANVSSSIAYGTWVFDVDVVDTYDDEIVIPFLMLHWSLTHWGIDCYFLLIVTGEYSGIYQPRLKPGKTYATNTPRGRAVQWFEEYEYDDILGWKHFIITREDDGQFYIYMNGTLACGFKDNQHQTCKEFVFASGPGPAIDNIKVYDEVIYDAAPPEWSPAPTDQVVELGQDFKYDINATDFSGLGTWTVNDTTNFAIDSNGVVTNVLDLTVGTYGLNVSVSDTSGFTRSATFTVTVEDSSLPPIGALPYLAVGGGAFLIVLVVVLIRNRR
ncbi:MAG: hypothetical protein ACFFBJ_05630 [Promethearchaeota archaeon]